MGAGNIKSARLSPHLLGFIFGNRDHGLERSVAGPLAAGRGGWAAVYSGCWVHTVLQRRGRVHGMLVNRAGRHVQNEHKRLQNGFLFFLCATLPPETFKDVFRSFSAYLLAMMY